ncbi:MAG TPA: ABC transporter ATP-binding protein [Actinomycetota bacterium]
MTAAIETTGLSKRYGRTWALRDCSLSVPSGRIVALVGPNGAGKTTLLHLAVGLLEPTDGTVRTLGSPPREHADVLARVGFVAQDAPLYPGFRVRDMLALGRHLNPRWDAELALDRIRRHDIDLRQRAGTLSGGQRAQVALALAVAKRPDLLVLDEPLASLDPLARREFLASLMEAAAESEITVLLSSHLVMDMERVCDYLIVLSAARVQVLGDVDELLATHRTLIGARTGHDEVAGATVISADHTERQSTLFVRLDGRVVDPRWTAHEVSLEDLVLAYLAHPASSALPGPAAGPRRRMEVGA